MLDSWRSNVSNYAADGKRRPLRMHGTMMKRSIAFFLFFCNWPKVSPVLIVCHSDSETKTAARQVQDIRFSSHDRAIASAELG